MFVIGDRVEVIARTRGHEGRQLHLIGKVGTVIDIVKTGNVKVVLDGQTGVGTYYPEELATARNVEHVSTQQNYDRQVTDRSRERGVRENKYIVLTQRDYEVFERFLQYGSVENARYLFVGMEEGLGREGYDTVLESRYRWAGAVDPFVVKLHGGELENCFYVKDLVEAAWDVTKESFQFDRNRFRESLSVDSVMSAHARILCMIRSNYRFAALSQKEQRESVLNCFFSTLHNDNSETAMIERYPLPKQGRFLYRVEGYDFPNYEAYIAYNERPDALRSKILREIYDRYDLPVSIGYAGVSNREFKLRPFYENVLGFTFTAHDTSEVHPITAIVTPVKKEKARPFLVGHRKRPDGKEQSVILTTFFGHGHISNHDLDVISTWIGALQNA